MVCSEIYSLIRTGEGQYALRTFYLPRTEVQGMRQMDFVVAGSLDELFAGLPVMEPQMEGRTNFVLPDNGQLRLLPVDMGSDFTERKRLNGMSFHGTRAEIMAQMKESLWQRGYHPRPNACFRDVDVPETLQKIMEHNTDYYQTDFGYDRETLQKAAEREGAPQHFFWLSRHGGTHCFPEENVYFDRISPHNSWNYYGSSRDEHARAFWVELYGMKDGKAMGNILELDYQKHLDYLSTHSTAPAWVDIVFQNRFGYQTFPFREYEQNWQSIVQEYGRAERIKYQPEDSGQHVSAILQGREMFWENTKEMKVEDYVALIDRERLHGHGYTADDLLLTGPMDAQRAVQHGLECFALNRDGTKESVFSHEAFERATLRGKLFGMEAGEKEILRYFKQDAIPLFTDREMQKIYALALQAGMGNEPGEDGVLGSILHKAECMLSGEIGRDIREDAEEAQEAEAVQEEMTQ